MRGEDDDDDDVVGDGDVTKPSYSLLLVMSPSSLLRNASTPTIYLPSSNRVEYTGSGGLVVADQPEPLLSSSSSSAADLEVTSTGMIRSGRWWVVLVGTGILSAGQTCGCMGAQPQTKLLRE